VRQHTDPARTNDDNDEIEIWILDDESFQKSNAASWPDSREFGRFTLFARILGDFGYKMKIPETRIMAERIQTSSSDETSNEWGPCPAGTVGRLVGSLKHHRRMRKVKQVTAAAGCLLVLVVLGRSLLTTSTPPRTLSHAEVEQIADQFIRGELDEERTRMVEAHIEVCPQCYHLLRDREDYRQSHGAQLPVPASQGSNLVAHSH
jgi:hypothetical protein